MDVLLTPLTTAAGAAIDDIIPLGIGVLGVLIALGIGLRVLGKFGVKK